MEINKNNDVENEICKVCNLSMENCKCNNENDDIESDEVEILAEEFTSQDISQAIEKYLNHDNSNVDDHTKNSDTPPQKKDEEATEDEKFPKVLHKAVRTPKKSTNIVRHIASVVVCVAIFAVTTLAVGWVALRYSLDNAVLQTAVMNVDVAEIELNNGEKVNLTNAVYDGIVENLPEGVAIDKNDVSDFLNEESVKNFIADKMSAYTGYIKGEVQNANIKPREITNFIKENESLLQDKIGYTPTQSDYQKIEDGLSEIGFEQKLNISSVEDSLSFNLEPLRGFLSKYIFVVILAILATLITVLAILNKKKLTTFLAYLGTSFAINGLALVIAISAVIVAFSYAINEFKWAKALISVPEKAVQTMGVLLMALGVLLILISVGIKGLQQNVSIHKV